MHFISIGKDIKLRFRNKDLNFRVDWIEGGGSTDRGGGTWNRIIWELKGQRLMLDHPLAIFFEVKVKRWALIKVVSHSAFSMWGSTRDR